MKYPGGIKEVPASYMEVFKALSQVIFNMNWGKELL